jgi:hypothetical protein
VDQAHLAPTPLVRGFEIGDDDVSYVPRLESVQIEGVLDRNDDLVRFVAGVVARRRKSPSGPAGRPAAAPAARILVCARVLPVSGFAVEETR